MIICTTCLPPWRWVSGPCSTRTTPSPQQRCWTPCSQTPTRPDRNGALMRDDIPSEYATGSDGALSNRLAALPSALFVYGTLQFDAVLSGLIGRVPEGTSAIANGWRAAALEGRVYPGLVLAPGSAAAGLLLTDLSQREWGILDAFEDDRYDLRKLCLTSGAPGWGYVRPGGEVRDEDWDAEHFVTRHLQECSTSRSRTRAGKLRTRGRLSAGPHPIRGRTSPCGCSLSKVSASCAFLRPSQAEQRMFSQYNRRTVSSISTGRSPTGVSARRFPYVLGTRLDITAHPGQATR
jgi:gamma-glutamylcyclotransferase (GGCT)/AIG2-like uncharacterized protein YtfP